MGFSLVVEGLFHHHLPDAGWRPLIESFGYTTGFVIVILGRQQLFTENTLTGVIPVLTRRDRETGLALARLWGVVLLANLVGAALFAALAALAPIFEPNLNQDFLAIGKAAASGSFLALLIKAVLAGWLIGLMVWLLPGAGSAQLILILLITYIVALGGFAHIIAGSVEVLYLVFSGEKSFLSYLLEYAAPVLLGNVIGGSALVAVLNHAQVHGEVPAVAEATEGGGS
jgi:formate/nitrite transporter FocA (FNT family)